MMFKDCGCDLNNEKMMLLVKVKEKVGEGEQFDERPRLRKRRTKFDVHSSAYSTPDQASTKNFGLCSIYSYG